MDKNLTLKSNILSVVRGQTWTIQGLADIFKMTTQEMEDEINWLAYNGFVSISDDVVRAKELSNV